MEEGRRSRRAPVEADTGNRNLRGRLPAIVAAAISLILSLVTISSYSSRDEHGTGLIAMRSWTEPAGERLRWSSQTARVHNPSLGQSESRNMLTLFQQQQWASHFDQLSETNRVHDVALSSYLARKGRYPESQVHDESMELEQHPPASVDRMTQLSNTGFEHHPPAIVNRKTQLSNTLFRPHSSFDDPGDFYVHQHYEYVPASDEGGKMSDEEGEKLWKELQRGYRADHPSSSTYPAVPVVFNEDQHGGHPAATGDDDESIVDDVGFHTPYENTEQGKRPQLVSRSVSEARTATPQLSSLDQGETEKKAKEEAEESGAQVQGPVVRKKESAIQKLYAWERTHHVDDKAAYQRQSKPPASATDEAAARRHAEEEAMKKQNAIVKKQEALLTAEGTELTQLKQKLNRVEQKQQSTSESTQQLQDELKYLHATTAAATAADPQAARGGGFLQTRAVRDSSSSGGDQEMALGLKSHRQAEADALKTAILSRYVQAGGGVGGKGQGTEQELAQAAGADETGAKDEDPIPRAVLSEAKEMVKDKAATELAQAEEASDTRDAAFIMGGQRQHAKGIGLAASGDGGSSGFSQLHAIEEAVLSKLAAPAPLKNAVSTGGPAAVKKASAKRLKDKKEREAKLEKTLSHEAIKGHGKELKQDESVRERALAFVKAFSMKA